MARPNETPFTARMQQLCDDAADRCPGYYPHRFKNMVDGCRGDFLPVAKAMIVSSLIHKGLMTIAKHGALDISLEAVVQQEPWRKDFSAAELEAAAWRLSEAKRRVDAGLPADADD